LERSFGTIRCRWEDNIKEALKMACQSWSYIDEDEDMIN
jgi:hypothetical protein